MGSLMEKKIGDACKTYHYVTSTSWKRAICGVTTATR